MRPFIRKIRPEELSGLLGQLVANNVIASGGQWNVFAAMGSPSADEISNAAYFLSLHRGGGREPVFDARAASNDYEQAAARLRSMLFGYCIVEKGGSANRIRAFVLDPDLARIWNIILRNEVAEFLISTAFNVSRDPIDWLTWETQSFLRDILLRQGWTVRSFEGIAACWSHQGV